jgi:hypothetical protein
MLSSRRAYDEDSCALVAQPYAWSWATTPPSDTQPYHTRAVRKSMSMPTSPVSPRARTSSPVLSELKSSKSIHGSLRLHRPRTPWTRDSNQFYEDSVFELDLGDDDFEPVTLPPLPYSPSSTRQSRLSTDLPSTSTVRRSASLSRGTCILPGVNQLRNVKKQSVSTPASVDVADSVVETAGLKCDLPPRKPTSPLMPAVRISFV